MGLLSMSEETSKIANRLLAIVNPAAGSGKCGKLAPRALERLRAAGVEIEARYTAQAGDGVGLARQAYQQGYRQFIAVGGDGTSFEIVNGIFPRTDTNGFAPSDRVALGFLPLGTGNSFLREFTKDGLSYATESILERRRRPCDVIRMSYVGGQLHYINLLSVGFTADVAVVANRRFKRLGPFGYLLGVITCVTRLRRGVFPLEAGEGQTEESRCLFLTFSNSKFTGGNMMIAPGADISSGLITYVRWGPIGRLGLLANLHTLFDGSHVQHPLASQRNVRAVRFRLSGPVDVMVDGEVLTLQPQTLEVLPGALDVMA
jgi:diacylglycerol kinase (ATP)